MNSKPRDWFLAVASASLTSAAAIALLATSAWLIVTASLQPPVLTLTVAVVSVRFFGISRGVFRYSERYISHDLVLREIQELRVSLWQRLRQNTKSSFRNLNKSNAVNTLVRDLDGIQDIWLRALIPWISGFVVVCVITIWIFFMQWQIGLIMFITFLLAGTVIPLVLFRVIRNSAHQIPEQRAELFNLVNGQLNSIAEIITLGIGQQAQDLITQGNNKLIKSEKRKAWTSGLGSAIITLISGLSILAIFYVSLELHLIGQVTPASIAIWTMLPLAIYEILITIPGSLNNWSQGRAAAQRIDEIASSNESRNEFLQDFTVSFKPGESIAIRGPSGSGKSTLLLTLLGLIDEKGELKIGDKILNSNVDIENDTEIVASMQDSYMFDSSIRENLTLSGENISESKIWDALKQVGLMELVAGLPNGLDELVGVNGSNFSGGEKQRLSLARVFLSQAPIIILDEPTEHLDNELSKIVFANIMKLCPDRTVIYASHKNVEINAATHLIQMNKGIATLLS